MASIEALLQAALTDLRRVKGTVSVLMLEREKSSGLLSDVQDCLNLTIAFLHGDTKKRVIAMEKRVQDWRIRQDRINL